MLSPLFDFLLEGGVPRDTLVTLLMFPIVATLIVAARQIVGIKSFGIYAPLIITFAFLEIDIKYGAVIFVLSLVIASMLRFLMRSLRMLYLPKMALILSITVLTMFLVLIEAAFSDRTVVANLSIYQVLIIITLVEKFINVQIDKGYPTAMLLATETLFLSSIGYIIVSSTVVQDYVFQNPAIILFFFAGIIFLGRYEGLRINEYFRFRNLFKTLP